MYITFLFVEICVLWFWGLRTFCLKHDFDIEDSFCLLVFRSYCLPFLFNFWCLRQVLTRFRGSIAETYAILHSALPWHLCGSKGNGAACSCANSINATCYKPSAYDTFAVDGHPTCASLPELRPSWTAQLICVLVKHPAGLASWAFSTVVLFTSWWICCGPLSFRPFQCSD